MTTSENAPTPKCLHRLLKYDPNCVCLKPAI